MSAAFVRLWQWGQPIEPQVTLIWTVGCQGGGRTVGCQGGAGSHVVETFLWDKGCLDEVEEP